LTFEISDFNAAQERHYLFHSRRLCVLSSLFFLTLFVFHHLDYDDPPLVSAELVEDEPEFDLSSYSTNNHQHHHHPVPTAPHASMVTNTLSPTTTTTTTTCNPQQQSQEPPPTTASTTTTTYTIPAPAPAAAAQTTARLMIRNLGRTEKGMQCPHCQRQMVTRVRVQADVSLLLLSLYYYFYFGHSFGCHFVCLAAKPRYIHGTLFCIVYIYNVVL
jgi:hypothetical protein